MGRRQIEPHGTNGELDDELMGPPIASLALIRGSVGLPAAEE
jgi:hypothetical protein